MATAKKQITVPEAAAMIPNDSTVWTGGWTVVRKPMALVYELIRQRKKNLHLIANPGGPEIDLLVGAGCADITECNYIGSEVFGHPYNFRRHLEGESRGRLNHDDWTVQTGALRIMAGAMGLPFIPTMSLKGSDITNLELDGLRELRGKDSRIPKKKLQFIRDVFWEGEMVALIPALRPDVCLIHAQEVGDDGTVRIQGGVFLDYYAAKAAKLTIVSAERIVPGEALEMVPEANTIPGLVVDYILEVSYGAHPTAVYGFYDNDPWWFKEYLTASRDAAMFDQWLNKWIFGPADFNDYLQLVGLRRLQHLRSNTVLGYNSHIKRRLDKLEEVN